MNKFSNDLNLDSIDFENLQDSLIQYCYLNDTLRIRNILNIDQNIDLVGIKDEYHNSLLHICTINNNEKPIQNFILYIKQWVSNNLNKNEIRADYIKQNLQTFVNLQNKTGYTASHYASLHGNIEVLIQLEKLGADFNIKTKKGLTLMHLAAQGNQPASLVISNNYYFLKQRGHSIDEQDYQMQTPLHYAVTKGFETSTKFITSWKPNLELYDQVNSQTAFHSNIIA